MLSHRIGHSALIKRYESAKLEIRRLRDVIRHRDETISKLRQQLAANQVSASMAGVVRPKCGCRHCIEVAGRRQP